MLRACVNIIVSMDHLHDLIQQDDIGGHCAELLETRFNIRAPQRQTQTSTKAVSVARREHLARQILGFDSRFRSKRFALYVCVQYIYMYLHFAMKSLFCSFVPRHILVNNVTRDCDTILGFDDIVPRDCVRADVALDVQN